MAASARYVRYRLDPSCSTCSRVAEWRRTMPRRLVKRPDMLVVNVRDPKALARHEHLWVRQCGGRFNEVVAEAMRLAGVPEDLSWMEAA